MLTLCLNSVEIVKFDVGFHLWGSCLETYGAVARKKNIMTEAVPMKKRGQFRKQGFLIDALFPS